MTPWNEMSELEQLSATYWDMYKDVYGYRPRHVDFTGWSEQTFRGELDILGEMLHEQEATRVEEEGIASHEFEIRLHNLMHSGATSRDMAMRWIHEAEGSNGDDEYLCYLLGLPYKYFMTA
jgi:hypothetical protein